MNGDSAVDDSHWLVVGSYDDRRGQRAQRMAAVSGGGEGEEKGWQNEVLLLLLGHLNWLQGVG